MSFLPLKGFVLCIGACICISTVQRPLWGFWAHKHINKMAVFRLPTELLGLYKTNIEYLTETAVNPDKRRYSVVGEAEKHFIDLDSYGNKAVDLPRNWQDAVLQFGEDSLRKHGILPWHLYRQSLQLTRAFQEKSIAQILRHSAELGHYIADAHVPLHTTRNYNGQLTGQEGIHAFWESRLPELFASDYDLWNQPVRYIPNLKDTFWETVYATHAACDSVLELERVATSRVIANNQYVHTERNTQIVKTPSEELAGTYHTLLNGQVERQMRKAIGLIGDVWYTCWVDAGQPPLANIDLRLMIKNEVVQESDSTVRLQHIRPEE